MDEVDAATSSTGAAGGAVGDATAAPQTQPNEQEQQVITPIPGARNYGYPDEFMMYAFKVEVCNRTDKHPRGSCPYAHPGDVARRRHPSRYQALLCPEVRAKKACPRLEHCQCSHSAFEFWLHPDRYRTSMCEKGERCSRPVCFFAHTPEELRPLPAGLKSAAPEDTSSKRGSSSSGSSARHQQSRQALFPACVPAGGVAYIQQQPVQQPIVLQPGMQLVPVPPAAGSPSSTHVGYVPVMQRPMDGSFPVPYAHLPGRYYTADQLQGGAVVMIPASPQPQQYVLQTGGVPQQQLVDPPMQQEQAQLPEVMQQFQQLVVASAPMGPQPYEQSGPGDSQWGGSSNLRPGQQQQQVVMVMQSAMGAAPPPAAAHQQVVYISNPVEQGSWQQQQQQQQQRQQYHHQQQGQVSDSSYTSYRSYTGAAGPAGSAAAPQGPQHSSSGTRSSFDATQAGSGGLSMLVPGAVQGVALAGGAVAAQPTSVGAMITPAGMLQPTQQQMQPSAAAMDAPSSGQHAQHVLTGSVMSGGMMLGPGGPHVLHQQHSGMVQMVAGSSVPAVAMPPPPPQQQPQQPGMDRGNW